ncbi:DUF1152 domain-containing protein [Coraliomargarita parva]|uniref:DUF1152 domain-containing protein n=1 Tax=Coraliomargarita parva TaxID=3014050 RepID=UPI0022B3EF7C|nr:DUF1152 domain-containing protein [Coraliomargarita parva]
MTQTLKPSLLEVALKSKRGLILGLGGGGDVIQGIPVARLFQQLGFDEVYIGGVSCQWWMPDGKPQSDVFGTSILGPTIYDIHQLSDSELLAPEIRSVNSKSAIGTCQPAEAVLAESLPGTPFVASLRQGTAGLAASLKEFVEAKGIDIVVGVDIGSDSFHRGDEVQLAHTSLVDFMSIGALLDLPCPIFYGVSGYGCDGEMQLPELDERVGIVMKAGGYLGAHGLTQGDVASMLEACEAYPDPVEPLAPLAATGELGLRRVNTHGPWGTPVHVSPLAAVMMFFDPAIMAAEVSKGILALKNTTSLAEAERIFYEDLGELPESRLLPTVRYFKEPGE